MNNDQSRADHFEQPHHEMIQVPRSDGQSSSIRADEWFCPTCGRRIIIEYPPKYKKIILAEGDQSASHSGGKGGVKLEPSQVTEIDPHLMIWQEWMDSVDFENRWEDHSQ